MGIINEVAQLHKEVGSGVLSVGTSLYVTRHICAVFNIYNDTIDGVTFVFIIIGIGLYGSGMLMNYCDPKIQYSKEHFKNV